MIPENHGGRGYPQVAASVPIWESRRRKISRGDFHTRKDERRPAGRLPPYPTKPAAILRPRQRAVLEVILQNPRRQGRIRSLSSMLHGTHDFSAAYNFRGGEPGNLLREHEIDFQLRGGLQYFVSFEQHSRPADVFGCAYVPFFLAEPAIAQRQLDMESLCARGREFSGSCGAKR